MPLRRIRFVFCFFACLSLAACGLEVCLDHRAAADGSQVSASFTPALKQAPHDWISQRNPTPSLAAVPSGSALASPPPANARFARLAGSVSDPPSVPPSHRSRPPPPSDAFPSVVRR